MPKNDMMYKDPEKRRSCMCYLALTVIRHRGHVAWVTSRGGSTGSADQELEDARHCSSNLIERLQYYREDDPNSASLRSEVARSPLTGTCDAFAGLRVFLHGVSEMSVEKFSLLATSSKVQIRDDGHIPQGTSESTSAPRNSNAIPLDLPLLIVEHKKQGGESQAIKASNQMRMHLTASVKFLEAMGITGFVVYGMITDGPRVAFPAAVLTNEGVYILSVVQQVIGSFLH